MVFLLLLDIIIIIIIDRGTLPDRERNTCLKLLLRLTLKGDMLDADQLVLAQEWLTSLEGTRRRIQTQKYYYLLFLILCI